MRPALSVVLVPSTPMNDDRLATAGSCITTLATASCLRAMAPNEVVCAASVMPWITPVSCTGKKPLGTSRYSSTVSTSVATATISVAFWRSSTHSSARP
ncbi:hypothetical protein D3C72_2290910 [compost metagenome]